MHTTSAIAALWAQNWSDLELARHVAHILMLADQSEEEGNSMTLRSLEVLPFNPGSSPTRVPSTDGVMARSLTAAIAESIVVPTGARYVRLAATQDIFATYGSATATIPGDVTDGAASELLSYGRDHWRFLGSDVTSISVIGSSTPIVTATFFKE